MMMKAIVGGVLAAAVWVAPAMGQSVEQRVREIEDGTVSMTVPSKPFVCGDGATYMAVRRPGGSTSFWGTWNDQSLSDCAEGPLHVVLDLRDGRVRTIDVFAGPELRDAARRALGSVDPQEAVDFLLDRIDEPDEDGVNAAFRAVILTDRVRVAERLMDIATDRSLDDVVRERAVRYVVDAARDEGVAGVRDALTRIALDRRDAKELRERVIRVLGEVPEGNRDLRALYDDLDRIDLRERVIRVAAEDRSPTTDEWLGEIAENRDERTELRERAIRVLGERDDGDGIVRAMYARLDRTDLRERAIRVVAEHRSETNARWLEALARDPDEAKQLRERAIRILGEDDASSALLRELYTTLSDVALKERIIRVLAENGDPDSDVWLRHIATDGTERVALRERAIRILGDERATSEELGTLYHDLDRRALQERVLRILGERDDDDAIDEIIEIAENETDRSLRDRAFRILADSSNERGRSYLIERLRGA